MKEQQVIDNLASALTVLMKGMAVHPDCTEDSEFEGFTDKAQDALTQYNDWVGNQPFGSVLEDIETKWYSGTCDGLEGFGEYVKDKLGLDWL